MCLNFGIIASTWKSEFCVRALDMELPQINVAIDELMFSLFQRPLHPELFQIYANRHLNTEKYESIIWVTGCTHVVSVFSGDICLTEC